MIPQAERSLHTGSQAWRPRAQVFQQAAFLRIVWCGRTYTPNSMWRVQDKGQREWNSIHVSFPETRGAHVYVILYYFIILQLEGFNAGKFAMT